MRYAPALRVFTLLCAAAAPSVCRAGPDVRQVVVNEAEVRAQPGNGTAVYVTNRLRRGDTVEVLQVLPGGWLMIRPPAGSISYINRRFLKHPFPGIENHVVAFGEKKVDVLIAREPSSRERPNIVGVRLPRGAQVVSLGEPVVSEDGQWMPIEPPEGEGRYILASAVSPPGTGGQPGGAPTGAGGAGAAGAAGAGNDIAPSRAPSADVEDMPETILQKAQAAESQGRTADAIRLYRQVGTAGAQSRPQLAAWSLQRAQFLQTTLATSHTTAGAGVGSPRLSAPVTPRPAANPPGGAGADGGGVVARTYRGRLRKAGRVFEDQTTYALEIDHGHYRPTMYVLAEPGVSLEPYLDRPNVLITGMVRYDREARTWVVTVSRVGLAGP